MSSRVDLDEVAESMVLFRKYVKFSAVNLAIYPVFLVSYPLRELQICDAAAGVRD